MEKKSNDVRLQYECIDKNHIIEQIVVQGGKSIISLAIFFNKSKSKCSKINIKKMFKSFIPTVYDNFLAIFIGKEENQKAETLKIIQQLKKITSNLPDDFSANNIKNLICEANKLVEMYDSPIKYSNKYELP